MLIPVFQIFINATAEIGPGLTAGLLPVTVIPAYMSSGTPALIDWSNNR